VAGRLQVPHSNIDAVARKRARTLRSKLTKAERDMWDMLREFRPYGARFRRETPVGPYIADFAWLSARLIVEVDGDTHETLAGRAHDARRDAFLKAQGFTVLRFDNGQMIEGSDHVFAEIERHVRHLLKDYTEI
jgi:very-short-patch-repair endonuclease